MAHDEDLGELVRFEANGTHASRAQVQSGKVSVSKVEITAAPREDDQTILSDMAAWNAYDRIRVE